MDNITHSLVGFTAAELVISTQKETPRRLRWALHIASLLGNNCPDLDFAYSFLTPGKLGYLLHHRGHTHTVLAALPIGLLIGFLVILVGHFAHMAWTRKTILMVLLLSIGGGILHIAMDSLNVYGVHPFWPWNERWFFGDTVFILEPALWVFGFGLIFMLDFDRMRWGGAAGILLALGLAWFTRYVPATCCFGLTLLTILYLAILLKTPERSKATIAALAMVLFIAAFNVVSFKTRKQYEAMHKQWYPKSKLVDVALSSLPANPFCWSAVSVEWEGDSYIVRRATIAPFPKILKTDLCPAIRRGTPSAPLQAPSVSSSPSVQWFGETRLSLHHMRELAANHCGVNAFLHFSRIPFIDERERLIIVGDARFDWDDGLGFAEMSFPKKMTTCPPFVPSWTPPRSELLLPTYGSEK